MGKTSCACAVPCSIISGERRENVTCIYPRSFGVRWFWWRGHSITFPGTTTTTAGPSKSADLQGGNGGGAHSIRSIGRGEKNPFLLGACLPRERPCGVVWYFMSLTIIVPREPSMHGKKNLVTEFFFRVPPFLLLFFFSFERRTQALMRSS